MPTYEYACKSCGEHLEVVQSFKDAALRDCPACGGALRKVFQPIGIAFKGSGFYKNDSRASASASSSSSSSTAGGDKADASKASSPDGKASSETKTAGSDTSSSTSTSSSAGKSSSAAAS